MIDLLRMRWALGAFATAFAFFGLPLDAHAGKATISGCNASGSDITSMSMNAAGDVVITCTNSAPGTPSCSITPAATTIATGASVTMNVTCSNFSPLTYAWVGVTSGAPAVSSTTASATVTFPAAGTFTYSVTASDASSHSASATSTITVNAPGTGGSCASTTVTGNTGSAPGAYWTINLPTGGSLSYKLPIATLTGRYVKPGIIWSSLSPDYLRMDMALSECPNDFSANLPGPATACFRNGPVSGFTIRGDSVVAGGTSFYCPLQINKQYYLNVRSTNCAGATCSAYLQYNGTF